MADCLARQNITQALFSLEYAQALSSAALSKGVQVSVHLKLDTGMGRIGFACEEPAVCSTVEQVCRQPSCRDWRSQALLPTLLLRMSLLLPL